MSQRPSLPIVHQHRLASPSLLCCLQANTFAHKIHPKTRCSSKVNIVRRLFMSKSRRTHVFCLLSAGRDPSPHVSAAHARSACNICPPPRLPPSSCANKDTRNSPEGFGSHIIVFSTTPALSFMKDFSFVPLVTIHVPAHPAIPPRNSIKSLNPDLCAMARAVCCFSVSKLTAPKR